MSIRVNVDWYLRSVQSQTLQIQHSNPILAWDVKTFLHHLRTNLNSYPSSLHSDLGLLVFQSISAPTRFSWESGPIVTIFVQIERGFAQLVMRSVATDVMTTLTVPRGEAAWAWHCGHNNNILMTWCQWQPITIKDRAWVTNERPELGSVSTFPCQLVAQLADNKSAYCDDHDTGPGNLVRPHICLSKPKWDDDLIRTWEPVVCTQDPTLGYQGTAETVRQYPHLVYCRVNPVFLHITDHSSNKLRSLVSLQTETKTSRRERGENISTQWHFSTHSLRITRCRPGSQVSLMLTLISRHKERISIWGNETLLITFLLKYNWV